MKMQFGLILSIGLLGCQAAGDDDATDSSGTELSYYQDIKPILDAHCVSCHNESGIGTFPLTTFEEVDVVRSAVANAIETGSMPPWKPTDGCNDYLYDPRLDQSLIDTVTEWVDGGAPEGSVEDEGDAMPCTTCMQ